MEQMLEDNNLGFHQICRLRYANVVWLM